MPGFSVSHVNVNTGKNVLGIFTFPWKKIIFSFFALQATWKQLWNPWTKEIEYIVARYYMVLPHRRSTMAQDSDEAADDMKSLSDAVALEDSMRQQQAEAAVNAAVKAAADFGARSFFNGAQQAQQQQQQQQQMQQDHGNGLCGSMQMVRKMKRYKFFCLFGGILGSASRVEFPVSLSNHVGFTPRLLFSSVPHSPESFIELVFSS